MQRLISIFQNKALRQKSKVEMISELIVHKKIDLNQLISFAEKANAVEKATCIGSIEFVTKKHPAIATRKCLEFITKSLTDDAPRVKWEAAKVIGNIAPVFPAKLKPAIAELLVLADYPGTVVRWAAAYALAEIVKIGTAQNKELVPTIEAISAREIDPGIRKKYLEGLKKIKK